jgi:hypothetical protein
MGKVETNLIFANIDLSFSELEDFPDGMRERGGRREGGKEGEGHPEEVSLINVFCKKLQRDLSLANVGRVSWAAQGQEMIRQGAGSPTNRPDLLQGDLDLTVRDTFLSSEFPISKSCKKLSWSGLVDVDEVLKRRFQSGLQLVLRESEEEREGGGEEGEEEGFEETDLIREVLAKNGLDFVLKNEELVDDISFSLIRGSGHWHRRCSWLDQALPSVSVRWWTDDARNGDEGREDKERRSKMRKEEKEEEK